MKSFFKVSVCTLALVTFAGSHNTLLAQETSSSQSQNTGSDTAVSNFWAQVTPLYKELAEQRSAFEDACKTFDIYTLKFPKIKQELDDAQKKYDKSRSGFFDADAVARLMNRINLNGASAVDKYIELNSGDSDAAELATYAGELVANSNNPEQLAKDWGDLSDKLRGASDEAGVALGWANAEFSSVFTAILSAEYDKELAINQILELEEKIESLRTSSGGTPKSIVELAKKIDKLDGDLEKISVDDATLSNGIDDLGSKLDNVDNLLEELWRKYGTLGTSRVTQIPVEPVQRNRRNIPQIVPAAIDRENIIVLDEPTGDIGKWFFINLGAGAGLWTDDLNLPDFSQGIHGDPGFTGSMEIGGYIPDFIGGLSTTISVVVQHQISHNDFLFNFNAPGTLALGGRESNTDIFARLNLEGPLFSLENMSWFGGVGAGLSHRNFDATNGGITVLSGDAITPMFNVNAGVFHKVNEFVDVGLEGSANWRDSYSVSTNTNVPSDVEGTWNFAVMGKVRFNLNALTDRPTRTGF